MCSLEGHFEQQLVIIVIKVNNYYERSSAKLVKIYLKYSMTKIDIYALK
ncbi:hypothetical protein lpari_00603 [Legionella parisiensis]|uniref:Uncharacterized protein n=1 Tax=Legionella parisiensis TaxID=45071 RepID=A0A1E5JUZ7_9GAMM|nr:hypothetical protein lpari_00603 [Legionella parisiensis]STX76568.1 Uncharacterised protein [Legionella parisiensis]